MNMSIRYLAVSAVVAATMCGLVRAQEPATQPAEMDWPKRELKFRDAPQPLDWVRVHVKDAIPPSYATILVVRVDGRPFPPAQPVRTGQAPLPARADRKPVMETMWILKQPAVWESLSPAQREFLDQPMRDGQPVFDWATVQSGPGLAYYLYAVTKEDARKMAEALVAYMDDWARDQRQTVVKRLQEARQKADEAAKSLATRKDKSDALQKEHDAGLTRGEAASLDEARQTIRERYGALRLLEIDLAGLRARLDAVTKYLAERKPEGQPDIIDRMSPSRAQIVINLESMLLSLNVEMAGILARKGAAEEELRHSQAIYGRIRSLEDARRQLKDAEGRLVGARGEAERTEKWLEESPEARPVTLRDDTVEIALVRAERLPADRQ